MEDGVAVVVSSSLGSWVAWHHSLDDHLALPAEAFGALLVPWGAELHPQYLRQRVAAKSVVLSKPVFSRKSLYNIPIIQNAFYTAPDGFGVVVDVIVGEDRHLSPTEFAVIDAETVIITGRVAVDDTIPDPTIHPDLLDLDHHFRHLLSYKPTDGDRQPLVALVRSNLNVLVSGPHAVGKSHSLRNLAEWSPLSYIFITGRQIRRRFDLKHHASDLSPPFIVVFDDIDEVDIHDLAVCLNSVSSNPSILAILAVLTTAESLPAGLRKRFNRNVQISVPTCMQRRSMLLQMLRTETEPSALSTFVADLTPGWTPSGLEILCRRARDLVATLDGRLSSSSFQTVLDTPIKSSSAFAGYDAIVLRLSAIKRQWMGHALDRHGVFVGGVLLHGPSGCGKTLLVQSLVQQDLSLNCITLSAASIYSKYLGDSEARLRKAFRDARQQKPCVIFIDDIDGISGNRDSGDDGDSGVKNRVLSTLLNELDGVSGRDGVYIVAATNRIDRIDSALLRPGRFDVHLNIGFPSFSDRLVILRKLIETMSVNNDVNVDEIARMEMTGADIRHICQRAGFWALIRDRNSSRVSASDFDRALREWADLHGR